MVDVAQDHVRQTLQRKPISAALKVRLEEIFKRASKKPVCPQDFDFAAELLAQCVIGDPGNPVYVRAYIENLQKKHQNNKNGTQSGWFKDRAARNALKKALTQGHWDEAIRHGLEALKANPWDVSTLTAMATAARESGDGDSELCYLKAALTKSPKDPMCNRMAAVALDEMGLVNQAVMFWERVLQALPKDKEAKEAISAFQVGAKTAGARSKTVTVEDQEELVRQRELQLQEEQAKQEAIREEEEAARHEQLPEPEDITPEPELSEPELSEPESSDLVEKSDEMPKALGMSEAAESPFAEGYDYGVDETSEVVAKRKKIDSMTVAVIVGVWLMMIVIAVLQWGNILWKQMQAHASLAFIGFGVLLLVASMMLRRWRG